MDSMTTSNGLNGKHCSRKQEGDWLEQFRKVCASWKLILKTCGIGIIVGITIILGTPKEYTASTFLAHEGNRRSSYSDISALAGMADDMSSSTATGKDALYPSLYYTIATSTPFLLRLFDIEVRRQQDSIAMTLAQYLKGHQKAPWWGAITSAPSRMLGWCVSLFREKPEAENPEKKTKPDPFRLTREEAGIAGAIASRISIEVDQKKRAITINVTMQDPQVAATVLDTLQARIKAYMTEYRTSKVRRILEYNEKLCKEAQAEYYAAQEKYTRYADANQGLVKQASRAELSRLQSEMNLAYSTYNQTEMQVHAAKARVDKVTPVYTVIRPVTVPLSPSKPNKVLILVGCILLSGAGSIGWVLFVKDFIKEIKKKRTACRQLNTND